MIDLINATAFILAISGYTMLIWLLWNQCDNKAYNQQIRDKSKLYKQQMQNAQNTAKQYKQELKSKKKAYKSLQRKYSCIEQENKCLKAKLCEKGD